MASCVCTLAGLSFPFFSSFFSFFFLFRFFLFLLSHAETPGAHRAFDPRRNRRRRVWEKSVPLKYFFSFLLFLFLDDVYGDDYFPGRSYVEKKKNKKQTLTHTHTHTQHIYVNTRARTYTHCTKYRERKYAIRGSTIGRCKTNGFRRKGVTRKRGESPRETRHTVPCALPRQKPLEIDFSGPISVPKYT